MKKSILHLFILLLTFSIFPKDGMSQLKIWSVKECGRYAIDGVIRKNPPVGLALLVNEKSKSEMKFTITPNELSKTVLYIDKSVSLDATILKLNGTLGEISSIENLKLRMPDPLHPDLDSGFVLSKKMECLHE
jgi:hypothetical protein